MSEIKNLRHIKCHTKAVTGLSFHPEGKKLVSCSEDKKIMLSSTEGNKCYSFNGHSDVVTSVDFASNGQLFASGSKDSTVRLWEPRLTGAQAEIKAHSLAVRTVAFNPAGDKLFTGSNDKTIKLWDVQTKKFIQSFTGHTNWVNCIQPSSQHNILASCSDDQTLRIWDLTSGQCVHVFKSIKGIGNSLSVHLNGSSVALAVKSGTVRVYDVAAKKLQQHYTLHDSTTCVAWHPSGFYFLSGGNDSKIRVVDAIEGRPLSTLETGKGPINSIAITRDGDKFASGSQDKFVMIWQCNLAGAKDALRPANQE